MRFFIGDLNQNGDIPDWAMPKPVIESIQAADHSDAAGSALLGPDGKPIPRINRPMGFLADI